MMHTSPSFHMLCFAAASRNIYYLVGLLSLAVIKKKSFFVWQLKTILLVAQYSQLSKSISVEHLCLQLVWKSNLRLRVTSADSCRAISTAVSSCALWLMQSVPSHLLSVISGMFVPCRLNALHSVILGHFAAFLFRTPRTKQNPA